MATTARIGNRKTWIVNVGAYNGGTHDHSKLFNRDANDQHPMGAIKGLETFEKNTKAHMASKENPHGVTAAQVGARPDTWMPTAAQVGAAPSGYGLGGAAVHTEDWNTTYNNGFYFGITNSPDGSWWYGYVVRDGADASRITQTIYRYGIICTRTGTTTDMGVWEYLNPAMIPDVEYRTTERYNGKPVYVKLIDVGDMPSNDTKTIYHKISIDRPLNIILTAEDAVLNWHPWFDQVRLEKTVLYIVTNNASASIYTGAQCLLKYTKT